MILEKILDEKQFPDFKTKIDYRVLFNSLYSKHAPNNPGIKWSNADVDKAIRHFALEDLYFFLRYMCNKRHVQDKFVYNRCLDVQTECHDVLDLWARGHFKSTIKTFGNTLRMALKQPDKVSAIFSQNKSLAKAFHIEIKNELIQNAYLRSKFRDIIPDPDCDGKRKQGKLTDEEIILKRSINRKEPTISPYGLIDAMPTGMHFDRLIYDDVVVAESVNTKEQIDKTTSKFGLSTALGNTTGFTEKWYNGTRYHFNDTYGHMIDKNIVPKVRIYKALDEAGLPVMMSQENIDKWRKEFGSYHFACQMMQNPIDPEQRVFDSSKIHWNKPPDDLIKQASRIGLSIVVDPAISQKKTSDWCVIAVWIDFQIGDFKYMYLPYSWSVRTGDKKKVSNVAEQIIKICKEYKNNMPIIETVAYQDALKQRVDEIAHNMHYPIYPQPNKFQQKSKHEKIMGLEPLVEFGRMYINPEYKEKYQTEFDNYPFGTDDHIECGAIARLHQSPIIKRNDLLGNLDRVGSGVYNLNRTFVNQRQRKEVINYERVR